MTETPVDFDSSQEAEETAGGLFVEKITAAHHTLPHEVDQSQWIAHLTDLSRVFLFSYSPRRRALMSWSKNASEILGVKDSAISRDGNLFLRHVHPDDRFLLLSDLERALNGEEAYQATYRWIRPDTNELRWLHCRGNTICRDHEEFFEGMILDLTAELTGTILQVAGPDTIATVLSSFPLLVITLDRDLRVIRVNRPPNLVLDFGDRLFKSESFRVGRPFLDAFGDPELQHHFEIVINAVLNATQSHHRERIQSGEKFFNLEILPLRAGDEITGALVTANDASDLVALEQRLADLERAQGVANIAKSVAHHVNNSLQAVIGHAALIRTHPDRPDLTTEASQEIIDIVQRTSDLTRELWSFDAGGAVVPHQTSIDCSTVILSAIKRCPQLFELGIELDLALGTTAPVKGSPEVVHELVEMLLRMVMRGAGRAGRISLRSAERTITAIDVAGLNQGVYTVVSMSSPGSRDTEDRASADLLAAARSLSEKLLGKVCLEAIDAPGISVAVFLPTLGLADQFPGGTSGAQRGNVSILGPVVLLVDDDAIVRSTVTAMLEALGFKVIQATSGAAAIETLRSARTAIGIVVLDALMPGLDGASTARAIGREFPGLPIIGFTGASAPTITAMKAAGVVEVLRKPIDPTILTNVIRQYLEQPNGIVV